MDNKQEINFEKMKKETEENFKAFSILTNQELNKVANFTNNDIDELLEMILENLKDISDLDAVIEMTKYKIEISQDTKTRLNYQKDLTKKDIFIENFTNIFLMYHAVFLGTWLTSPNGFEFLKRFLIVGLIGLTTYEINATYFASEHRKNNAKLTIAEIDKYVAITKYDIDNINRFRDIYVETLKNELSKFTELATDSSLIKGKGFSNLLKVNKLLKELNLEYIVEEPKTKKLTK